MPESIRERILKNIVSTLKGITLLAGYQFDIGKVQRFSLPGIITAKTPYILISENGETVTSWPVSVVENSLSFSVIIFDNHVKDGDEDDTASDSILDVYHVDINKALMVDATRAGLAIETRYEGYEQIEFEEGSIEISREIRFRVRYENDYKDMTQGV